MSHYDVFITRLCHYQDSVMFRQEMSKGRAPPVTRYALIKNPKFVKLFFALGFLEFSSKNFVKSLSLIPSELTLSCILKVSYFD